MKKIQLFVRHDLGEPITVDADRVLCNNVTLPGEGLERCRLWVILNAHGPMGAVWANSLEDALDELVDQDLARGILIDEKTLENMSDNDQEHLAQLGNAGEYCDLTDVIAEKVTFNPGRDWKLLCKFAEARGAGHDNLDF